METFLISTSNRFLLKERIDYFNCFTHFTQWEYIFIIRGKPFFKPSFYSFSVSLSPFHSYLCLVLDSKKVGASIKNPLLGLKQPWGLRCVLYKQFNIWSMADLCTLPWLFVLMVPCCDCLPTLPDLIKRKRKETDEEWLKTRYTWIIHS